MPNCCAHTRSWRSAYPPALPWRCSPTAITSTCAEPLAQSRSERRRWLHATKRKEANECTFSRYRAGMGCAKCASAPSSHSRLEWMHARLCAHMTEDGEMTRRRMHRNGKACAATCLLGGQAAWICSADSAEAPQHSTA
eukprot:3859943-Pleurochrysis_carterae.AAC.1